MEGHQVKARASQPRLDGLGGIPHADQGVDRKFQHVLGIDLGGGKGKKTALATLRVDGAAATVVDIAPRTGAVPFYDPTLLETIRAYGDETLLCIDAPLTLPPCLRCTVPVCPGQELCVDPSVVEMRALVSEPRDDLFPRAATVTRAGANRRSRRTRSAPPRSTWRPASASPRAKASDREPARSPRAPRTSCVRSPTASRSTAT